MATTHKMTWLRSLKQPRSNQSPPIQILQRRSSPCSRTWNQRLLHSHSSVAPEAVIIGDHRRVTAVDLQEIVQSLGCPRQTQNPLDAGIAGNPIATDRSGRISEPFLPRTTASSQWIIRGPLRSRWARHLRSWALFMQLISPLSTLRRMCPGGSCDSSTSELPTSCADQQPLRRTHQPRR